jgi:biotin carboxylase
MQNKNLLIIGAGREQIPAYQKAKQMGLKIISTDIDKNAPAFKYADHSLIASTRDSEQSLKTVKSLISKGINIDGVMTIANDVPLTVAKIADFLALPSISIKSATMLSNKKLMKEAFTEFSVSTPEYRIIRSIGEVTDFIDQFGLPIILKPLDGRGSKGVMYIDDLETLHECFNLSKKQTSLDELLVEKFKYGQQLSVESIFSDGKYVPIAYADRNYKSLNISKPFIFENGGIMPSRQKPEMIKKIDKLVEDAAKSLSINWGSVKADIVISENKPHIIELAGRLSGGDLCTFDIPNVYNVDLVKYVIELSLGKKININKSKIKPSNTVCSRYIYSTLSGKISSFEFPINHLNDIFATKILDVGDHLNALNESSINNKAAVIRVLNKDLNKVEEIAESFVKDTVIGLN